MVDPDNTVFFDIHTESAVTGVTLEIDNLRSETGIFRHTDGKLYIAAIINYPGYGHIWHVVTDVYEKEDRRPAIAEHDTTHSIW